MSASLMLASVAATAGAVATSAASAVSTVTTSAVGTGTIESIVASVVPSLVASALPSAATTTIPVTAQPLFLPVAFEVAAIFAGALSGSITAVSRRFDITGVMVLALVNGLGGGIMRDVLLQEHGIFALENPRALLAVLAAAAVGAFFVSAAQRIKPVLSGIDAMSLGLFTLVGADKALVAGMSPLSAILLGMTTAIGGGIIRDLLCDREPQVMRRGSLYAIAAVVGSTVFVTMATWLNFAKPLAMVVAGTVAVSLRLGSVWLGWESPEPLDLTPHVTSAPRRLWQAGARMVRRKGRSDSFRR